ncbi:MAG: EAL domain-containing protein [Steroidobacteraceae bacterium]
MRDVSEDAGDATIVRTIIDMGRSLGLDVVAEGIESQRHLDFLREHHCQFGQGKLFSEADTIDALLPCWRARPQARRRSAISSTARDWRAAGHDVSRLRRA